MRHELIDGDCRIINRIMKDGWEIVNTFPNPYPQPYFFALMRLNTGVDEDKYPLDDIIYEIQTGMKRPLNPEEEPF